MATTKITNPDLFDLGSLNTALQLPSGTTAERPTSPSTGEWRYNTTTNLVEYYDGGSWRELLSEAIPPIPSEHFNTVLYTGNGSTQSITGVGFQPDFVWIKERGPLAENHNLTDSTRGTNKILNSNNTNAEITSTSRITSFDSGGFTLGNNNETNDSGSTYVAWCWKANGGTTSSNTDGTITSTVQVNSKAGFSIVQWTGTGSAGTLGHGLSSAPEMIIVKDTSNGYNWYVYSTATGSNIGIEGLNTTALSFSATSQMTSTSTLIENVPSVASLNTSGANMLIYAFHSVAGYSKIGSYAGNGSDAGPIINTGFEPAWLMIKVITGSGDGWFMVDNKRDTSNPRGIRVFANSDVGDASEAGAQVDFLTNGFQLRGSGAGQGQTNKSGSTYLYLAFASDPSTAPVLADSFDVGIYTGDGTSNRVINTVGFRPDLYWLKTRDTSGCTYHNWFDTLRGGNKTIYSNASSAEVTNQGCGYIQSFDSLGVTYTGDASGINNNNEDFVYWAWKANPMPSILTDGTIQSIASANQAAGFSIVKYVGNGVQGATVAHGLGSAPDLIIIKDLSSSEVWLVGNSESGWTKAMHLDLSNADNASNLYWDDTAPTSSVFSIGAFGSSYNVNGNQYIAYCWHSISGYSKIGSYTGNGSSQSITTGFPPNWLMFKRTDQAGWNWEIADTARGVDVDLAANSSGAEQNQSPANRIQIDTNGFTHLTANYHNISGASYIYVAFKENPTPIVPTGELAYLVVAGGGGGAITGGSGGAGGLRTSFGTTSGGGSSAESNITLSAQTYTITVGAGGAGLTSGPAAGNPGNDSVFGSITSIGGGEGLSGSGGSGGSGGGANGGGTGGSGTANQGFDGGLGFGSWTSGGGGGAAQVGQNAPANEQGGDGGNGLAVSIIGSSVTYAGGGGGAGGTSLGSGGDGGGGNGGKASVPATSGTVNTGSGGGAQTNGGATISGGGGSGVVVLRMRTSDYSGTTTGSPTVTTLGEETILTYTGSGTYVHS